MMLDEFNHVLLSVGKQVNTLFLYYMGEPFLNRDTYDMIASAEKRGLYVSVCTNGEHVDVDALAESGVSEVSFQISGLSPETHGVYRVNGDLWKTLNNMSRLASLKKKRHLQTKITVGFIVMKHNKHEIPLLDRLVDLGADNVQMVAPCVRTIEQGKMFLPTGDKYWYYDRAEFDRGVLTPRNKPHNRCWWIYYSTVVNWNGDVVPCCRDAQGDHVMGNALEQDFREIWNGDNYRRFRARIATKQDETELCRLCSGYSPPRLY